MTVEFTTYSTRWLARTVYETNGADARNQWLIESDWLRARARTRARVRVGVSYIRIVRSDPQP